MSELKFNRRQFLAALSLGTGYALFANPLKTFAAPYRSEDPFQLVKLGKSGLETTLLGMGTGINGNNRSAFLTRQDKSNSLELLRYAYDSGIRMFDCADSYGTHPLMAEALRSMKREELLLVSKMWTRSGGVPDEDKLAAEVVVERFLRELKTDYIDLVQLHCMVDTDWTDSQKRYMEALDKLKHRGLIRAHGTSVHSLPAMKASLASDWVDVIHVRINPYGMAMDKPEPEEVVSVIHKLHNSGKGVIGMKLVGGGRLRNENEKMDNSLRFVLGLNSIDMTLVGFESREQIDDYTSRMNKALAHLNRHPAIATSPVG